MRTPALWLALVAGVLLRGPVLDVHPLHVSVSARIVGDPAQAVRREIVAARVVGAEPPRRQAGGRRACRLLLR